MTRENAAVLLMLIGWAGMGYFASRTRRLQKTLAKVVEHVEAAMLNQQKQDQLVMMTFNRLDRLVKSLGKQNEL